MYLFNVLYVSNLDINLLSYNYQNFLLLCSIFSLSLYFSLCKSLEIIY
ncbi:unnamed protein product [Spirodela intermedia]|uniref:Uncharacterized protein n=2 Tax=Spirodela intermedia TaxID=51605 RepID=A0A7I8L2G7_SPIIN|nr:unnamed protein product [Spirodela intermedia]CAA6667390.1 unnamed protein product [Spirodela intermedia]CAA7404221.1 unnamed protein product [Spirodela intermedia]